MIRAFLPKFSWTLCFVWILGLAGLYIFQVTALTRTAFSLGSSEQRVKTLQSQIRTLEARAGQSRSAELSLLAGTLSFEKIQNISYVRLIHQAVAQNTAR